MTPPDIILIHGLGDRQEIWNSIDSVLGLTYRVHRIDLPGHSEGSEVSDLSQALETVLAQFDSFGAETPLLVGHSLGGLLALLIMMQRETSGLVVLDQPFGPSSKVDTAAILQNSEKIGVQAALNDLFTSLGSQALVNDENRGGGLPYLTHKTLSSLWSGGGDETWNMLAMLLAAIPQPILSLEWDNYGDNYSEWIKSNAPKIIRETMPGAQHHWFFLDLPHETAARISSFYDTI